MNQTNLLTSLEFGKKINESQATSASGNEFLTKYRGYVMTNPVSCGVVNRFLNESANFNYDDGVVAVRNTISSFIKENKFSWMLASACERINESSSSMDVLSKHAVKHVEKLLEMNEADVVNYIKAGALKNVQYVTEFRNIASQVYKDKMPVIETLNYKIVSPISFVESKDNNLYFCVLDRVFECNNENIIKETSKENMSDKFNYINSILGQFTVEEKEDNMIFTTMDSRETTYTVENKGMVVMTKKNENPNVMTVDEFREYTNTYTKGLMPHKAKEYSQFFENICKIAENFDNICYIDNTKIISTGKANVSLIEGKSNYIVTCHNSFTSRIFSESYNTIVEALDVVKGLTQVDLRSSYKEKIDEELAVKAVEEQKQVEKELEAEEIKARKQVIEKLANKFKDDPIKLALVNNIAKDIAALEE